MRTKLLLIPALLLVPFAIIACGDDDNGDGNGDEATPTTSAENGNGDDPNAGDPNGQDPNGENPMEGADSGTYDFDSAAETENGVRYIDQTTGEGDQVTLNSEVVFHYQGTLEDGTVFDSSYLVGEPVQFPMSNVIPGFAEGMVGMQPGGERAILVPSELAYGSQGISDEENEIVPPDADLIFEIELLDVNEVPDETNPDQTDETDEGNGVDGEED